MAEYSSYMWSVPDWRTDEMYTELDNREQGVYRNLIDECWVRGSIDASHEVLARFSREPIEYFRVVWAKISKKFRPIDGGKRLISPRLEQDRRRLMLTAKFTEKRARKAANVRWAKERAEKELHAISIAQASSKHTFEQCQIQTHVEEEGSPLQDSSNIQHTSFVQRGRTARKTRAPATLAITGTMRQWAQENGITVDLDAETAAMLDHHRGKGNLHGDWAATWRTWMRNTKRFNGNGNGNGRPKEHYQERVARENRETAARLNQQLFAADGDGAGTEDPIGADRTLLPRVK